jgi:RimJ/RimL family protein N-acetyltransferase
VIRKFLDQIVFADASICAVLTDPEENNRRSLRAFENVGFTIIKTVRLQGESARRSVICLSRPHEGAISS